MDICSVVPHKVNDSRNILKIIKSVKAGPPSMDCDEDEPNWDLNEVLIQNPAATFFVRVDGNSMEEAGIFSNDILIVDKSLVAEHGSIIIAILNEKFLVKRLETQNELTRLLSANPEYPPFDVTPDMDFEVWGVVTFCLHKLLPHKKPTYKRISPQSLG